MMDFGPQPSTSHSTSPEAVSTRAEEAMKYRLKQRAVKLCMQAQEDYARCCSDKVLSVVWACRAELRAFSDCCHQHTNPQVLERVKQRWLAAGSPSTPDWDKLLADVS